VVVVVVGPGTAGCVVCDDVVVVLPEGVDPQADSRAIVAASRLGMMIFFMVIFLFWISALRPHHPTHGIAVTMGCCPRAQ